MTVKFLEKASVATALMTSGDTTVSDLLNLSFLQKTKAIQLMTSLVLFFLVRGTVICVA